MSGEKRIQAWCQDLRPEDYRDDGIIYWDAEDLADANFGRKADAYFGQVDTETEGKTGAGGVDLSD